MRTPSYERTPSPAGPAAPTHDTERLTDAALRRSEQRFQILSELTSDFTYALRVNDTGVLTWEWVTEAVGRVEGLSVADLPALGGWSGLVHPDDRRILDEHYARLRDGAASEIEIRITTRTGATHYLRDRCRAIRDGEGTTIYGSTKDVTSWKLIGQALRSSEERFRGFFEQASDLMLLHDRFGSILDANRHACESLGYSREELQKLTIDDLDRGLDGDRAETFASPLTSATPTTFDTTYQRKDGSRLHVEARFTALESSGQIVLLSTARDVTERRRAEQALRESETQYRRIVETVQEGIWEIDAEHRTTFANQRMAEMLGTTVQAMLGEPIFSFMDDEGRALAEPGMHRRLHGISERYEVKYVRADGTTFWAVVAANPITDEAGSYIGALALVTDVSERRRAEEELFQAQKLESVGRLAAGIAHEINTPIQFVGDNVQFLKDTFATLWDFIQSLHILDEAAAGTLAATLIARRRAAEEEADLDYLGVEIPRAIGQTLEGIERVASIVRALKSFAHPDHQEKVAVDLNQMLSSTLIVARNEIKYVAEVETAFGDLPPVYCHPGAVNQVFLNLLVNAAHAVTDKADTAGGRAVIRVRTTQDGEHAIVAIEDTGCGIPESIRVKVFDQFFTTKEVGRGTGQGLALARRIIVDQHGGALSFESKEGVGTTFFVRLPLRALDRSETAAS